jgi:branched-chain amino acid transport system permease protein
MKERLRTLDRRRVAWVDSIGRRWRALPRAWRWAGGVAGIVLLYLLPIIRPPFITTPDADFDSVLFYPVAVYVLVAIGLNIVVGYAGLLDLGYVAFFAVGAYSVAAFGAQGPEWPWLAIVPIGVALAMVSGVILGSPTLRLRGDYLAIVTLGFGEIVRIIARNTDSLGGPNGITGLPRPPSIGPLEFNVLDSMPYYWLALTVIILVIIVVKRLEVSRVGRAWTAIREDEDAAELMGVPTFQYKLWAFALGAAVGGLAGTLYGAYTPSIAPETFRLLLSILFLAAVVLGGAGNLPGVILGAFLVAYLPERFRNFQEWRVFAFGVALVVMMIFRPQGLLPSKQRQAEAMEPQRQPDFPGLAGADLEESIDPMLAPQREGHV